MQRLERAYVSLSTPPAASDIATEGPVAPGGTSPRIGIRAIEPDCDRRVYAVVGSPSAVTFHRVMARVSRSYPRMLMEAVARTSSLPSTGGRLIQRAARIRRMCP